MWTQMAAQPPDAHTGEHQDDDASEHQDHDTADHGHDADGNHLLTP